MGKRGLLTTNQFNKRQFTNHANRRAQISHRWGKVYNLFKLPHRKRSDIHDLAKSRLSRVVKNWKLRRGVRHLAVASRRLKSLRSSQLTGRPRFSTRSRYSYGAH